MAASHPPLDLVVRFSTSNPDVVLPLPNPATTSALSLKQQIRAHLESPASTSRLRLIHAGKVLNDAEALSRSLHVANPPPSVTPRAEREDNAGAKSEKAKGKQPVRDGTTSSVALPTVKATRVYIHCSIGDVVSAADLEAEAAAAKEANEALSEQTAPSSTSLRTSDQAGDAPQTTTTTPAPRGFDRLLATGFTPSEVAHLRANFLAIQAHTHTPDTMPTGADLLALEERWLDNTVNPTTGGAVEGELGAGGFASEDAGGLEDMLWGNLMGFFWPIGGMCWLLREEGVWTRRRQIAVLSGLLVNLTFGFLRVMN